MTNITDLMLHKKIKVIVIVDSNKSNNEQCKVDSLS